MINRNTRIFPHLYFARTSISFRNASGFEFILYAYKMPPAVKYIKNDLQIRTPCFSLITRAALETFKRS